MPIDFESIRQDNPLEATVQRLTGQPIIRHKIRAPWRSDSDPSVHIYDDGHWHDFGSGRGGDVLDFVGFYLKGEAYNSTAHLFDVIDFLGSLEIRQIPRPVAQAVRAPDAKKALSISLEEILRWHEAAFDTGRSEYWHSRGLTEATMRNFYLGWDGRRYTIPHLYRLIPFGVKRRQSEIEDGFPDKYLAVKGSRGGLFNTDSMIGAEIVVICEGEIDAMLVWQAGFASVSTTVGAGTFKADWVRHFQQARKLYILYDNDRAGEEGAAKVRSLLRRAQIVRLPDGIKDVGDLCTQTTIGPEWLKENIR
jgi:DNA primase